MAQPQVRYARSGRARIAYAVVGDGPVPLVMVTGPATHLDLMWELPDTVRSAERLARFARLVLFDRRGTGLSDPMDSPPVLDQQMDDLQAVIEAAGLSKPAL